SGRDALQPDLVVAHDDHGVDIRGVRVLAVGDRADLVDLAGPQLRAPDPPGRPVVPGQGSVLIEHHHREWDVTPRCGPDPGLEPDTDRRACGPIGDVGVGGSPTGRAVDD